MLRLINIRVYIRHERYYDRVTQEYYSLKDIDSPIKTNIKFDLIKNGVKAYKI